MARRSRLLPERLILLAFAAMAAGCPIGCPEGQPQTVFFAPPVDVAVRRTGTCTFQITDQTVVSQFPSSDEGFYGIDFNDDAVPTDWVSFDQKTRTFTILDRWCEKGIDTFAIQFFRKHRVAQP